jgi:hypothetical protein
MKEDVLEQILDDYLMHKGYFTRHNIRFKPSPNHIDFEKKSDAVASDIDVVGIHPHLKGEDRVVVVSCKAWQGGFNPAAKVAEITGDKIRSGREAWKGFRELCRSKWSEAFLEQIEAETSTREFTYYTVVTRLLNSISRSEWEENPAFRTSIGGNPIRILTLAEMLDYLWGALRRTPASSEIGRAIQLMKAADWHPPNP